MPRIATTAIRKGKQQEREGAGGKQGERDKKIRERGRRRVKYTADRAIKGERTPGGGGNQIRRVREGKVGKQGRHMRMRQMR